MASYRIAAATADGLNIRDHFGFAEVYGVVDINDTDYNFVETRKIVSPRQSSGGHDETAFARVLDALSDCEAIVVAKIGSGAAKYVLSRGVRVFTASGEMKDILPIIREKMLAAENAE